MLAVCWCFISHFTLYGIPHIATHLENTIYGEIYCLHARQKFGRTDETIPDFWTLVLSWDYLGATWLDNNHTHYSTSSRVSKQKSQPNVAVKAIFPELKVGTLKLPMWIKAALWEPTSTNAGNLSLGHWQTQLLANSRQCHKTQEGLTPRDPK